MNASHRVEEIRQRLADEGYDAFVVTKRANLLYLTGFEGVLDDEPNAACVVTADSLRFYTDFRYREASESAAEGTPWSVRVPRESLYIELCAELAGEGVESLVLESSVPFGRFKFLSEQFGGRVVVVDQWVEEVRQIKEPGEVDRVQAAAELADSALSRALELLGPGVVERDLALEIEVFIRRNGGEAVSFPPIVAGGPNSSRPHATVTDRAVASGDLVTIDLGAKVDGYCSDLTRTVVVGRANERQREVYAAVLDANIAAIEACRPGLRGSELHAVAADLLSSRGLGEAFGHGLGHGVGLEVHELPTVGPRGGAAVRSGSVITIEPGVYVPGFGGVRIEDLVVVESGGCRVLSAAPKELIEIG